MGGQEGLGNGNDGQEGGVLVRVDNREGVLVRVG